MLNLQGQALSLCDGISRRSFMQIGGLAMGGMALPQLLQAEAAAGVGNSKKSIIMIFLPGGPPHQDMWDLKMDAPSEVRGEFTPISTNVPGIEICELFPRLAGMSDKLSYIRSMVGCSGQHYAHQCLTGHDNRNMPQGGWPALGSVLSHMYGPVRPDVPAFVGLSPKTRHAPWGDPGQPGFLGVSHAPFQPNGDGREDMTLNGVTLDRLGDRKKVLSALDGFRSEVDRSGMMDGMDSFKQQAFGILTSSRLADALDVEKEDVALRDRYGRGSANLQADGGPKLLDNFLIARRLVEAGVRCVTLCFSRWDWHGGNFKRGREDMPMLDQALSALVEDLDNRGMLDDTSIVCWGEFGRTPKINQNGGRDHWPRVSCALLAGGGMRHGQVIGATNRLGEYAAERPVHFQEVFATLYKSLGIDTTKVTLPDFQGRPQYLVDSSQYQVMPELI